ncbi:MAG TPA: OmpH family outer membrane protein [Fluviicoccus sp.]|nr:OmpH family outer membrane protein [Fluviicoccus sp.]
MRSIIAVTALVLGVAASASHAAGTVAVADSQAAIMSTDYAKKTFEKLNNDMKPQRDRLESLRKDLSSIEEKFQKNGSIMSAKEKTDLQNTARQKLDEFNNLAQAVQKRAQDVQQEMVQKMLPKMEVAVDEIRVAANIDIIIERKNVIWSEPSTDITKKITEKLNAAMNAPAAK